MKNPLPLGALLLFIGAAPMRPLPPHPEAGDAPTTLPAAITPTEKSDLFNGRDFSGWISVLPTLSTTQPATPPAAVWSIHDGLLTCTGKPNGYLRTEKSYANYKLTLEWRFTKSGNTGVLVHINPTPTGATPDKVWPTCIECQGAHLHQGDFWIWSGAKIVEPFTQRNGLIMKTPSAEKPLGEWNTFQVACRDHTVTISVNGTEMSHLTTTALTSGQIALQSEGAAFEVRKLTLEPLAP
jgi:hypothetical protein